MWSPTNTHDAISSAWFLPPGAYGDKSLAQQWVILPTAAADLGSLAAWSYWHSDACTAEKRKDTSATSWTIPIVVKCIQFPAICEHLLTSDNGISETFMFLAMRPVTGNPKDPNFSRPVMKRFLWGDHKRPPAILSVGNLPLQADQQRRTALSPR